MPFFRRLGFPSCTGVLVPDPNQSPATNTESNTPSGPDLGSANMAREYRAQMNQDLTDGSIKFVQSKIEGWTTQNDKIELMNYVKNAFNDKSPAEKLKFIEDFKKETGYELSKYLACDLEPVQVADCMLCLLGDSADPGIMHARAEVIGKVLPDLSEDLQRAVLKDRPPNELAWISCKYAENAGSMDLMAVNDRSAKGVNAAIIHSNSSPALIEAVLAQTDTPEKMLALDKTFRAEYPELKIGVKEYLLLRSPNLPDKEMVASHFKKLDDTAVAAIEKEKTDKETKIASEKAASEKAEADKLAANKAAQEKTEQQEAAKLAAENKAAEERLKASEIRKADSDARYAAQMKVMELREVSILTPKDEDRLSKTKAGQLMLAFEAYRQSPDAPNLSNLQEQLKDLTPSDARAIFNGAGRLNPNSPVKGLSTEESTQLSAYRREWQVKFMDMIANRHDFNFETVALTGKGMEHSQYNSKMADFDALRHQRGKIS
jgi:hypothetical protein